MDSLLRARELYGTLHPSKNLVLSYESHLMDRMGLSMTLEGHEGCVNTLRWNNSGSLLVSGSDDRTVRVWGIDGSLKATHKTTHTFNIFGVEFVPYGEDRIVASGAGDNRVKLHDVSIGVELNNWNTRGRVKRLATAQDQPFVFWSSSEDGNIREHDARSNTDNCVIKVFNDEHIKTFAVCQGRTELVAVGVTAYVVPIYDRRNPREPLLIAASADQMCCPAVGRYALYATHVAFDYYGRELLVNQNGTGSGGTVFLFDLEAQTPSVTMEKLGAMFKPPAEGEASSTTGDPEVTRILAERRLEAKTHMVNSRYHQAVTVHNSTLVQCSAASKGELATIYANRAIAYLARRRAGDTYASVRDNIQALLYDPGNEKAMLRLAKGFMLLEQYEIAKDIIQLFKERFPNNNGFAKLEAQLETGTAEDKPHMVDMRSSQNTCLDYTARFLGHTNMQTDIKEANFFGSQNQYIVAGSDCGSMVIWDRASGNIKNIYHADDDILNIVQPHTDKFMIASSGIEKVIRFWEPLPEGTEDERRVTEEDLVERSQQPRPDMLVLVNALMRVQHNLMQARQEEGQGDGEGGGCAVQ